MSPMVDCCWDKFLTTKSDSHYQNKKEKTFVVKKKNIRRTIFFYIAL